MSKIPYSIESEYSPSVPDLFYRTRTGPYMEIYVKECGETTEIKNILEESIYFKKSYEFYYLNFFSL